MKDKFTTFIMIIIMILIVAVFIILGGIIINEIQGLQTNVEVENFQSEFSGKNDEVSENITTPEIVESSLNEIRDNTSVQSNSYENVNVNNYYYNQLEEPSKIIYRAFSSNEEQMRSGTYKIEFGDVFTDILEQSNGQELLGEYYQSAIEAYTYDNPEIFYLSPNKMYLNIETTTTGRKKTYYVYINNGNEANYLIDEFTSQEQVENAISQIEEAKNQILSNRSGDTYNDIKMVHDYLVDTVEYDLEAGSNIYNIYGTLIDKRAVCEGYARAFKYILDEIGIPCVLGIGTGTNSRGETERHAWNYVEIEGNWYAVDSTWDDPVVVGGGIASPTSKYKYFLKGSNEFYSDHKPSGQFTPGGKEFSYPDLSINSY